MSARRSRPRSRTARPARAKRAAYARLAAARERALPTRGRAAGSMWSASTARACQRLFTIQPIDFELSALSGRSLILQLLKDFELAPPFVRASETDEGCAKHVARFDVAWIERHRGACGVGRFRVLAAPDVDLRDGRKHIGATGIHDQDD